jgi:hypothetical protein
VAGENYVRRKSITSALQDMLMGYEIKYRTRNVPRVGYVTNAYTVMVRKTEGKLRPGNPTCRYGHYFK